MNTGSGNVNADSGMVNTDSGKSSKSVHLQPEWLFTLNQNRCSRSSGMGVHDGPEYAVFTKLDSQDLSMGEKFHGVAVVTGASRGVGRGIAIALGAAGMTVYVTGRSATESNAKLRGQILSGTLEETAEAITKAGGKGIAVACDHAIDEQVRQLFARVER